MINNSDCLTEIRTDLAGIRRDIGDLRAELMFLRVVIENAARLIHHANEEPKTDHIT